MNAMTDEDPKTIPAPDSQENPLFTRVRDTSAALEAAIRENVADLEQVRRLMRLAVAYGDASFDYGEFVTGGDE